MQDNTRQPLLDLQGISKSFGPLRANDDISISLSTGEVLALLGENGAGKSTLMNIIFGIYHPDAGKIFVRGKEVKITSPKDAMNLKIGMVHQHFMLVGRFSAIENIVLINGAGPFSRIRADEVRAGLEELKKQYGIDVDLDCPVEQLSISGQQKIEILKLLYTGAEILILDEPTAVLLPQESEALFEIIRNMTKQNKGVIFISHKLDEVLEISDRINVLSHGKVTGKVLTSDADKNLIVRMMSGDNVPDMSGYIKKAASDEICLACTDVTARDDRHVQTLNGVTFTLHKGEIVGVAGVEGNGQEELAQVLAGTREIDSGSINASGTELAHAQPSAFIGCGIGYIPSDRITVGTVPNFPLFQNWMLRNKTASEKHGFLNRRQVIKQTSEAMSEYDVRAAGPSARSANLSGGNLQKFILARELNKNPNVLICSHPTRGLDVKASWFIRNRLTKAKENGTGVLVFSSDLEELFSIADRIVVLYRGRIIGSRKPEETTTQEIVLMMMGGAE